MDLLRAFPFRAYISLEARRDRRERLLPRLRATGLDARWFKPIKPSQFQGDARGFASPAKRSLAMAKRAVLRAAERSQADAVLILEDDVVFPADFLEGAAALVLPDDWGIFYFGCQHIETPMPLSAGLVRVRRALDCHAFAVRRPYYRLARAVMRGGGRHSAGHLHSDVLLSSLHHMIPTYAAFPNLAWQGVEFSDLANRTYSNYQPDGTQKLWATILEPIAATQPPLIRGGLD